MKNYLSQTFILFIILASLSIAQTKDLTFEQAYLSGSPRLTKALPAISISETGNSYLITDGKKIKRISLPTNSETLVLDYEELNKNIPQGFDLSKSSAHTENYNKFILKSENDIHFYNKEENKFKRLTNDNDEEENPTFSPDGNFISYTKSSDLYVYDLQKYEEIKLTDDGTDLIYNGYASWIYYEEILGRGSRYRAFYWSPDSKQLAYMQFDDTKVPTFTLFNADGVHGELEVMHYPKPGDPNPDVKLGVVNIESKKTTWIDNTFEKGNYIAWPMFTSDSKRLVYQKMNRGQDDLEVVISDIENPNPKRIYRETQKTWVEFLDDLTLLEKGDGFLIRSEVEGWHHIYHYNLDGKLINKITDGEWSVKDIAYIDEETKSIYFHASKERSTEKHLYKIKFNGNEMMQLTKGDGTHSCTIIPTGQYFLDKWSSVNHPTKLVLYNLSNNKQEVVADSKLPEMDDYKLGKVELFAIPTEDGYNLPAKWFLPFDFDETKKYPMVFSVYGGPGTEIVSNSFPRRGLGNYFLSQNGIIVIEIDNRGAGHFGKKGKDEMHRKLGTWEIDDMVSAVKWLKKKSFIDSAKIAITGGSYGGYTTSMALVRAGEYFKYGIAKYAVTDWRLYDNVYTERFMDTPEENPEGYKYGSVMTHAENYNGGMLITHGSLDDNVHMQNTIQLIDILQNFDKDFELMIYPNQRHGIRYPKYPHSAKLDVDFWFKNLLGK